LPRVLQGKKRGKEANTGTSPPWLRTRSSRRTSSPTKIEATSQPRGRTPVELLPGSYVSASTPPSPLIARGDENQARLLTAGCNPLQGRNYTFYTLGDVFPNRRLVRSIVAFTESLLPSRFRRILGSEIRSPRPPSASTSAPAGATNDNGNGPCGVAVPQRSGRNFPPRVLRTGAARCPTMNRSEGTPENRQRNARPCGCFFCEIPTAERERRTTSRSSWWKGRARSRTSRQRARQGAVQWLARMPFAGSPIDAGGSADEHRVRRGEQIGFRRRRPLVRIAFACKRRGREPMRAEDGRRGCPARDRRGAVRRSGFGRIRGQCSGRPSTTVGKSQK